MMIVFNGYISDKAKKRFIEKKRIFELLLLLFAFGPFFFIWVGFFSQIDQAKAVISGVLMYFIIIVVMIVIVPSIEKENKKIIPNKIYTDGTFITAVSESNVETKRIDWVKQVIDHGDFYEVTFRFGRMSNTFICQQNLLTQGTLKDFEALFKDKIVKKDK